MPHRKSSAEIRVTDAIMELHELLTGLAFAACASESIDEIHFLVSERRRLRGLERRLLQSSIPCGNLSLSADD